MLLSDKRYRNLDTPVMTTEPFCLEELEFGWRHEILEIATTFYLA